MKIRTISIASLALTGVLLAGCGSKDDKASTTSTVVEKATDANGNKTSTSADSNTNTSSKSGSSDTTAKSDEEVAEGVISIKTDEDSQLGTILVDNKGLTLYMHTKDGKNSSACTGACAASWIPVTGTSIEVADGLDSGDFELFDRGDGDKQVSFNGHPLYRFSSDKKRGQTNGQGVNYIWYVAGANGEPVKPTD